MCRKGLIEEFKLVRLVRDKQELGDVKKHLEE